MTSLINRQPKGIPVGGQFAPDTHAEPSLALDAATTQTDLTPEGVFARAAEHTGPGIVPALEDQYEAATTEGGRRLLLQRIDSQHNPDSPHLRGYSSYDLTPERCDELAALGYTDLDQLAPEKLRNVSGVRAIADNGITPDRLEVIGKLKRHEFQWSAWEREALMEVPVEDLEALSLNTGTTAQEQYLGVAALLDSDRYARAKAAFDAGITDKGLIEAVRHEPAVLAGIRDALPDSKRNALHIVGLANNGITGEHLKKFGAKACDRFTGDELDAATLSPAAIKSLVGSGVQTDLAGYARFHDAGYTKGTDLKDASKAMGTTDADTLIDARRHTTGTQLGLYRGVLTRSVTVADAHAIGRLNRAGITSPDQLRPWSAATTRAANWNIDRSLNVLDVHADVVEAGLTPEQLGRLSRAGIPVDAAPRLKDTPDPWAAGKEYRDAYEADQRRLAEKNWIREPKTWAYTEENYQGGEV